jgi:hypothetical protein
MSGTCAKPIPPAAECRNRESNFCLSPERPAPRQPVAGATGIEPTSGVSTPSPLAPSRGERARERGCEPRYQALALAPNGRHHVSRWAGATGIEPTSGVSTPSPLAPRSGERARERGCEPRYQALALAPNGRHPSSLRLCIGPPGRRSQHPSVSQHAERLGSASDPQDSVTADRSRKWVGYANVSSAAPQQKRK